MLTKKEPVEREDLEMDSRPKRIPQLRLQKAHHRADGKAVCVEVCGKNEEIIQPFDGFYFL